MNTVLLTAAIVATTYAWIRFCDWVIAPWLARRAAEQLRQELAVDAYIVRPVPDEAVTDVLARIRSAGQ